ncbi:MAG: hypothetical protein DWQ31_16550 [Planctomycetota bacterium]|nr:MAG: hypothetical protein DWQ31_16550 [Planctomycetota bacterium]
MSTPQLSPAPTKARNIGSKDLQRREELLELARSHEQSAKSFRRQIKELDDDIRRYVLEKEPKKRSLVRCGYRLSILATRKSVSWVTEFVKRFGESEKKKLADAQPLVDKLVIEKA